MRNIILADGEIVCLKNDRFYSCSAFEQAQRLTKRWHIQLHIWVQPPKQSVVFLRAKVQQCGRSLQTRIQPFEKHQR